MLAWLASWNGYHHHMAAYLVEEVLSLQKPEIQHFLVCTAILPA